MCGLAPLLDAPAALDLGRRGSLLQILRINRMRFLLVSFVLVLPAFAQESNQPPRKDDGKMAMQKIDGDWTVTYAEMDGKKLEGKGFTQVTIKNNVVTCKHDGKEKSWHLHFGPHHMVRCTEQTDGKTTADAIQEKRDPADKGHHTHHGIYIASQEYFCLSMHKGRDHRHFTATERRDGEQRKDEKGKDQPGTAAHFGGEHGPHGAHFVLILHRSSSPTSGSR